LGPIFEKGPTSELPEGHLLPYPPSVKPLWIPTILHCVKTSAFYFYPFGVISKSVKIWTDLPEKLLSAHAWCPT